MKRPYHLLLITSLVFIFACDDDQKIRKGTIELHLFSVEPISDADAILITVTNADESKIILQEKKVSIHLHEDHYMTELSLPVGDYQLSSLEIIDASDQRVGFAIDASMPIVPSELPQSFTISTQQDAQLEIDVIQIVEPG